MSGSETEGAVKPREPFTIGVQKTQAAPEPVTQNMHLAYSADGTAVFKPVSGSVPPFHSAGGTGESPAAAAIVPHNLNMNMGVPMKKKRGRPRKYGPDGTMSLGLTPARPVAAVPRSGGTFSPSSQSPAAPFGGAASPSSLKKAKARPHGSSKKQQLEALGSAGFGFTPHVITVKAGEDVSSKIMSFSQNGPRAVCILSANGAISNVTLRQAATSGGTATYEGRFDILSLSGSFLLTEVSGQRSRTGGLSVSLAGPDGLVLGGCVAGLLTAASPVQVIVGSFVADGRKESKPVYQMEPPSKLVNQMEPPSKLVNQMEPLSAPWKFASVVGSMAVSSPPSHGTLSESSGGPGSPINQSTGACNNSNPQPISSMLWR